MLLSWYNTKQNLVVEISKQLMILKWAKMNISGYLKNFFENEF